MLQPQIFDDDIKSEISKKNIFHESQFHMMPLLWFRTEYIDMDL